MRRVLKTSMGIVWLLVLLTGGWRPTTTHAQDDVSWLLEKINALRASQGLPGYTLNGQLSTAATWQSQYLVETCNVVHVRPDGSSPQSRAAAAGYAGDHVFENIYAGTNATAADAWNFWVGSSVHYAGLTSSLATEIGIGIAHGGVCSHAYTLLFGRGASGEAAPVVPSGADTGGESEAVPVAAVEVPYVPPQPTSTPTATIPTLTPSATWTLTPTYTPSLVFTAVSPTATPLSLPTVAAQDAPLTAVAAVDSPTPTAITPTVTAVPPSATPSPTLPPPTASPTPVVVQVVNASRAADESGFAVRDLIPFALVGQIALIGIAGFVYFRKAR